MGTEAANADANANTEQLMDKVRTCLLIRFRPPLFRFRLARQKTRILLAPGGPSERQQEIQTWHAMGPIEDSDFGYPPSDVFETSLTNRTECG